jgi:hypothetical protein
MSQSTQLQTPPHNSYTTFDTILMETAVVSYVARGNAKHTGQKVVARLVCLHAVIPSFICNH